MFCLDRSTTLPLLLIKKSFLISDPKELGAVVAISVDGDGAPEDPVRAEQGRPKSKFANSYKLSSQPFAVVG